MSQDPFVLPEIEWEEPNRGIEVILYASVTIEGFDVRVSILNDTDHNWGVGDWRGKFTDKWEQGAIENPCHTRNTPRWFVSTRSEEEITKDILSAGKHSPAEAREMAQKEIYENARIAADPESLGFQAIGVEVVVSKSGVELGRSAIWGSEVKGLEDAYVQELVRDEAEEAIRIAQKKLAAQQA